MKNTSELDRGPIRLLLLDMRTLLCDIEWGGMAHIDQCVVCGASNKDDHTGRRDPRSDGHRAGCRQKSMKRRIDAMLRIFDSEGG